jgi:hypothetical protein
MKIINPIELSQLCQKIRALHLVVSNADNSDAKHFWQVVYSPEEIEEIRTYSYEKYCQWLTGRLMPETVLSHEICMLTIALETGTHTSKIQEPELEKALKMLHLAREYQEHIAVIQQVRDILSKRAHCETPEFQAVARELNCENLSEILEAASADFEKMSESKLNGAKFTLYPELVPPLPPIPQAVR